MKIPPSTASLVPGTKPIPFKVVLLTGAAAKDKRAKQFTQHFVRTLERSCDFLSEVWTFPKHQMPNRRDPATAPADDASAANAIIQALHEESHMPDETRAWIETWLVQRVGTKSALVQLIDPGKSRPTVVVRLSRLRADEVSRSGKKYLVELMGQDDRSRRPAAVSAARAVEAI